MDGIASTDRAMLPAVTETLAELDLSAVDSAARRLVESYARQLDRAAAISAQADRVLKKVQDPDIFDEIAALKAKVSEQAAWSNIGPKLLNVLVELGATPKSRIGKPANAQGSRLAALRAARTS